MREYITVFLSDSARQMEILNAKALTLDLKQFQEAAHALKPQFQFMGIKKLNEQIAEIEQIIPGRQLDKTRLALARLNEEFTKSCLSLIESLVALA